MMFRYTYLGDKLTAPELRGMLCNPVRRPDGKCIVGRMPRNQLVEDAAGRRFVVLARRLRLNKEEPVIIPWNQNAKNTIWNMDEYRKRTAVLKTPASPPFQPLETTIAAPVVSEGIQTPKYVFVPEKQVIADLNRIMRANFKRCGKSPSLATMSMGLRDLVSEVRDDGSFMREDWRKEARCRFEQPEPPQIADTPRGPTPPEPTPIIPDDWPNPALSDFLRQELIKIRAILDGLGESRFLVPAAPLSIRVNTLATAYKELSLEATAGSLVRIHQAELITTLQKEGDVAELHEEIAALKIERDKLQAALQFQKGETELKDTIINDLRAGMQDVRATLSCYGQETGRGLLVDLRTALEKLGVSHTPPPPPLGSGETQSGTSTAQSTSAAAKAAE